MICLFYKLQEPERALEIYEEARKRNPRDTQLAAKMGQALQKTHQYGKAINYYREAVKNEDHGSLRFDLAELLVNYSIFLYLKYKIYNNILMIFNYII